MQQVQFFVRCPAPYTTQQVTEESVLVDILNKALDEDANLQYVQQIYEFMYYAGLGRFKTAINGVQQVSI